MSFVGTGTKGIPIWLAVIYLSSNVLLNSLNIYWFGKMIETVRKRFEKKPKSEEQQTTGGLEEVKDEESAANGKERRSSIVLDIADGLEKDERLRIMMDGAGEMDGRAGDALAKLNTLQRRDLEDEISDRAKTSALENSTDSSKADNSYANGSAAKRR